MAANLTGPRPDLVFLRRRLKPGEVSPVEVSVPVTKSSGLNLSRNRGRKPDTAKMEPQEEVLIGAAVPTAVGLSQLKRNNDAVRLNRRQSAIGSLVIANAIVAGWQLQDGSSGYIYNNGVTPTESAETKPLAFKGRTLVEFQKELLVIGLRNIKYLKRLIVIPKHGETLQAETIGGAGVLMDFEPFTVLYISVIDSMVEFRKEDFRNTITDTFNLHTVKPQKSNNNNIPLRTLFS